MQSSKKTPKKPATKAKSKSSAKGKLSPEDKKLKAILENLEAKEKTYIALLEQLQEHDKPIWVQEGRKKKLIKIGDIAFITTNPRGLDIFTTDGKKHINFESLANMQEYLKNEPRMMRTHRSYIINLRNINTVAVVGNGRELTFHGVKKQTARVTYEYLDEFMQRVGEPKSERRSERNLASS